MVTPDNGVGTLYEEIVVYIHPWSNETKTVVASSTSHVTSTVAYSGLCVTRHRWRHTGECMTTKTCGPGSGGIACPAQVTRRSYNEMAVDLFSTTPLQPLFVFFRQPGTAWHTHVLDQRRECCLWSAVCDIATIIGRPSWTGGRFTPPFHITFKYRTNYIITLFFGQIKFIWNEPWIWQYIIHVNVITETGRTFVKMLGSRYKHIFVT